MPTALIGPALSAGTSILSGILGSSAAGKAAAAQKAAQDKVISTTSEAVAGGQKGVGDNVQIANNLLQDSKDQQLDLYHPYTDAGTKSLSSLESLSGDNGPLADKFSFNPSDLASDPGYAFTLQQGQAAIQRAAASQGGLFSSGTLKSLAGYTTGTANQYFGDAFNRALNTFDTNRSTALSRIGTLQGLAQLGYNATGASANTVGSTATQQANNSIGGAEYGADLGLRGSQVIGNALTGKGNSEAAGIVGGTNAITGAISNGSRSINDFLAQRQLKNVFGGGDGGGSIPGYNTGNGQPSPYTGTTTNADGSLTVHR